MPLKDITENKVIAAVILLGLSLWVSWSIWVTTSSFTGKEERRSNKEAIGHVTGALGKLELSIGSLQVEVKEQGKDMNKNQQDILKMLNRMERNNRDR